MRDFIEFIIFVALIIGGSFAAAAVAAAICMFMGVSTPILNAVAILFIAAYLHILCTIYEKF